jgi:hypothetical protein
MTVHISDSTAIQTSARQNHITFSHVKGGRKGGKSTRIKPEIREDVPVRAT